MHRAAERLEATPHGEAAYAMLKPQADIDASALQRGLKRFTNEVVFSSASDSLMGGTILTAFALFMGARPSQIGILTAVAFWAQLLQAPGVLLVERMRMRKLITVLAVAASTTAIAGMLTIALTGSGRDARIGIVAAITVYCGAGAIGVCAWNAWARDLIPGAIRGGLFARRSRLAIVANVLVGLAAALTLEFVTDRGSGGVIFAGLFAFAIACRLLSAAALARVPEPEMPPAPAKPERLVRLLREPLRDRRFRPLIRFNTSWQFAVNLALPFFTVFFLQQLGLPIALVMAFSIVSQLASVWALKRWAALADRFGEKSVLNVAAPTFFVCIVAMVGASQIGPLWLAAAYLVAVHVVMGVAGSGVGLASGNIALKLSPKGAAAPYLSLNALISSAIAGVAPILGGLGAEFFAARRVGLVLEWTGPVVRGRLLGVQLTSWDFYFVLSALCGLYALHRLTHVRDEGELGRREMTQEILARVQARFARPPISAAAEPPEEIDSDLLAQPPAGVKAAPTN